MISAAARDARMADHLERFLTRSVPVRRFLSPAALARAMAVNLRAMATAAPSGS
jgi:hypothetical protein